MERSQWIRIGLCGLVAGVVWHLLSILALSTIAPDLATSVQRNAPHSRLGGEFFFAIDLGMGVWAIWLYAEIAPRYGARSTAAVVAGTGWWLLKTLQSAKWAGLGFLEPGPGLIPLGVATLAAALVATMAGARLYASPMRRSSNA